ncbi:hypothetical protein NM688_g6132 [Phlebia brevispora]|uniref:Uncharacterized protein n=1 Tax=Phlebia brevispora TaxID=194682 RepID=A0ACC1SJF3_9APHY|nr:hypothetical protein NM688_g6132 [Phlebia brevispora]
MVFLSGNGRATPSLLKLSDELLLRIAKELDAEPHRTPVLPNRKGASSLYALSLVCRRLRRLLVTLLLYDIECPNWYEYDVMTQKFTQGDFYHANCVRSITIGTRARKDFDLLPNSFPFVRLSSFDSLYSECDANLVQLLTRAQLSLRKLALKWDDAAPVSLFSLLGGFPTLQHLRVHLSMSVSLTVFLSPQPATMPLTHLVLHDLDWHGRSRHVVTCLKNITFPTLRVVGLYNTSAPGSLVFDFVNRHPTILECNVSLVHQKVRFEALLALIQGTGTWLLPTEPEDLRAYIARNPDGRVDEVSRVHEYTWPNGRPHLPDIETYMVHTQFDEFAFCRKPLPGATMLPSSVGSIAPRYTATALAYHITDPRGFEQSLSEHRVQEIISLAQSLRRVNMLFPDLEELRLWSDSKQYFSWDSYPFPWLSTMDTLTKELRAFQHLRRLTIRWLNDEYFRPGDVHAFECQPWDDIAEAPGCWRKATLRLGFEGVCDCEHRKKYVCEALSVNEDQLDLDDENIWMYAWEAKNTEIVREAMQRWAEACPSLEMIEWYCGKPEVVAPWRWNVMRNADGSVSAMTNYLMWDGGPRGEPLELLCRVGEELRELE